jgi:hypothetical protein
VEDAHRALAWEIIATNRGNPCGAWRRLRKLELKVPFLFSVRDRTDGVPSSRYFFQMLATTKPDPELLPIHRPRCPICQTRMITAAVAAGPQGFEQRTFECRKCGHTETGMMAPTRFNQARPAGLQVSCDRQISGP